MSGLGKCFFEIPIYRCDQNQHTKETEKERKNYIASRLQFAPELLQKIDKQIRTHAENDFNVHLWYPWRYNEVVGWIPPSPSVDHLATPFSRQKARVFKQKSLEKIAMVRYIGVAYGDGHRRISP